MFGAVKIRPPLLFKLCGMLVAAIIFEIWSKKYCAISGGAAAIIFWLLRDLIWIECLFRDVRYILLGLHAR